MSGGLYATPEFSEEIWYAGPAIAYAAWRIHGRAQERKPQRVFGTYLKALSLLAT